MFGIDDLRLLAEVARCGSFTAAAEELNYTQSAVSRRIAALESSVGCPLFERLPRGVRLTPTGVALNRHGHEVLARLAAAQEEVDAIRMGRGGRLRVGAFATANAGLVPGALREFQRRRPNVSVTLTEGLTAGLLAELIAGTLDIAVVSDHTVDVSGDDAPELVHLLDEELLVVLPSAHPCAGDSPVRLRDLADDTWIAAAAPGADSLLQRVCGGAGFSPRVGIRVAEWTGKLGFVAAGLGVALLPSLAVPAVRSDVVVRSLGPDAPSRRVFAALPREAVRLPAAMELLNLLKQAQ